MNIVELPNNTEGQRVKQVFDYLLDNFQDKTFGFDDIPGENKGIKSEILATLKYHGLRESVGVLEFALTAKAKQTQIELV